MTASQYLKQLRRIRANIQVLECEIEFRRTKLESTSKPITSDRVQTSVHGDRFADMMAALADKEVQLEDMLWAYSRLRDKIVREILELEATPLQVLILHGYYAEGKTLTQIASEQHYSNVHIWQQHAVALDAFEAQYSEKLKEYRFV